MMIPGSFPQTSAPNKHQPLWTNLYGGTVPRWPWEPPAKPKEPLNRGTGTAKKDCLGVATPPKQVFGGQFRGV